VRTAKPGVVFARSSRSSLLASQVACSAGEPLESNEHTGQTQQANVTPDHTWNVTDQDSYDETVAFVTSQISDPYGRSVSNFAPWVRMGYFGPQSDVFTVRLSTPTINPRDADPILVFRRRDGYLVGWISGDRAGLRQVMYDVPSHGDIAAPPGFTGQRFSATFGGRYDQLEAASRSLRTTTRINRLEYDRSTIALSYTYRANAYVSDQARAIMLFAMVLAEAARFGPTMQGAVDNAYGGGGLGTFDARQLTLMQNWAELSRRVASYNPNSRVRNQRVFGTLTLAPGVTLMAQNVTAPIEMDNIEAASAALRVAVNRGGNTAGAIGVPYICGAAPGPSGPSGPSRAVVLAAGPGDECGVPWENAPSWVDYPDDDACCVTGPEDGGGGGGACTFSISVVPTGRAAWLGLIVAGSSITMVRRRARRSAGKARPLEPRVS
jgi:hypothetical protein